jgi:hypothetical protein
MKMKQKFVGLPGLDEFIRGQIAAAVEEEREACAALCETTLWYGGTGDYPGKHMASLIRSRAALTPVKDAAA